MKRFMIISIVAVLIGFVLSAEDAKPDKMSMMASDSTLKKAVFDVSGLGNSVVAYSTEKNAIDLAKNGPTVYFFAASWCPTCKATYKDVVANFKNIPKGYTIIFVNYDTEKELKAKYAVSYQHTFVQIDQTGKSKKVWSGSVTIAEILKNIITM